MNIGYEDNELQPYVEPEPDYNDPERIGEVFHVHVFVVYNWVSYFVFSLLWWS